jgi:hypothetical protein
MRLINRLLLILITVILATISISCYGGAVHPYYPSLAIPPVIIIADENGDPQCMGVMTSPTEIRTEAHCREFPFGILPSGQRIGVKPLRWVPSRDWAIETSSVPVFFPHYGKEIRPSPGDAAWLFGLCPFRLENDSWVVFTNTFEVGDFQPPLEKGNWDLWASWSGIICPGDSGAPLLAPLPDEKDWKFYGTLSWASVPRHLFSTPFDRPISVLFGSATILPVSRDQRTKETQKWLR